MHPFSDNRLNNCCYCGGASETRDHVPSKVFLDLPYPPNLPLVECCNQCNNSFSLDEEYLACALECLIQGTTEIDKLSRQKVKNALDKNVSLKRRIEYSRGLFANDNEVKIGIEKHRLFKILMKLARGHIRFENSEHYYDEPTFFMHKLLKDMTTEEFKQFNEPIEREILPELGSRAFLKVILHNKSIYSTWTTVQDGNYRYFVHPFRSGVIVRFIIFDFLACEAIWQ